MPPIYFNVEEARNELLRLSRVYTIRHQRNTGGTIARVGGLYKFQVLGYVKVKQVLRLHKIGLEVQLSEYVPMSGFKTVQEWIANVKEWKDPMYLYHVEVMKWPR